MTNTFTDKELRENIKTRLIYAGGLKNDNPTEEAINSMVDLFTAYREYLKREAEGNNKIDENTSDGYHTFKELYEFRKVYNAALFNEWSKQGLYNVYKSERHSDGEQCFGGGWFIVMATLPTGQISNHYEMKDWNLFTCEIRGKADKWDGHTPQDVMKRLLDFTNKYLNL